MREEPKKVTLAIAPYNFVPLPKSVYFVDEGYPLEDGTRIKPWENQHRFLPGTCTGWIDFNAATLTPLFVGDAKEGWVTDSDPLTARLDAEGRPVIPASTIRGCIRNMVEILSFGRLRTQAKKLTFRKMGGAMRKAYGDCFSEALRKTGHDPLKIPSLTGFMDKDHKTISQCEMARIKHEDLEKLFPGKSIFEKTGETDAPKKPNHEIQYKTVWVIPPEKYGYDVYAGQVSLIEKKGDKRYKKACLVLTGEMRTKKKEFVFIPQEKPLEFKVPREVFETYEDGRTPWQEETYKKGDLQIPAEGEPFFFLPSTEEKGKVAFLGKAGKFRIPYDLTPNDLNPTNSIGQQGKLDLPEALFGRVGEKSSIRGRVFFEDCRLLGEPSVTREGESVQLPTLGSAKVSYFPHYLEQPKDQQQATWSYLEEHRNQTKLRGFKLYWHRSISKTPTGSGGPRLEAVIPPKTLFRGRVRFEGLSKVELGALLSALQLPEGCAHKIGLAKPLGMGTILIKTQDKVTLVDPAARYGSWSDRGEKRAEAKAFIEAFEKAISEHAARTKEESLPNQAGGNQLARWKRLAAFYRLVSLIDQPSQAETSYLQLSGHKEQILPAALDVGKKTGDAEPKEGSRR